MDQELLQKTILPGLLIAFLFWKWFQGRKVRAQLPEWIQKGAVIVDVRSPGEFASGANPQSRNIPLNELSSKLSDLDPHQPVILCCASGTRSGMAASLLRKKGFTQVLNAGAWSNTKMIK